MGLGKGNLVHFGWNDEQYFCLYLFAYQTEKQNKKQQQTKQQ